MKCYYHMRFIILKNVLPTPITQDGDTLYKNQLLKKKKFEKEFLIGFINLHKSHIVKTLA